MSHNADKNGLWLSSFINFDRLDSDLPKARFYRTELEPYLNKTVCVVGVFSKIKRYHIFNTGMNLVLFTDVFIIHNMRVIPTDHMWVAVERGFMDRNNLKLNDQICASGYLYEYTSKRKRNIGLRLLSIRKLPRE